MTLSLYNTASRAVEEFTPHEPSQVSMYTCGPTVYNFAHIGNLRAYIFADVLRRALEASGYHVRQIVNITDVGHLVSDADLGQDKMELGAAREGKTVEEIVAMYSDAFFADSEALNIQKASAYPRATHYIEAQKTFIETLTQKGLTYTTSDGIYFDTSKFPEYADFARLDTAGMQAGTRVDMGEKKRPTDFALWKFSPEDGQKREQEWDSPLIVSRKGFPGWHIECSAIIKSELGETIDIHTGGIDHIPVHHTNEIAQSVSLHDGAPLAHFWMHSAFMNVDGQKMSKSLGNTYTLADLKTHGISPLAFRYWLLTAHYRTQVNFTWEALRGAQTAYNKLCKLVHALKQETEATEKPTHETPELLTSIFHDLDTAGAIARMWEELQRDKNNPHVLLQKITALDSILGLKLLEWEPEKITIPSDIQTLLDEREEVRKNKDWSASDRLRDEIFERGFVVNDTPEGQELEHRA